MIKVEKSKKINKNKINKKNKLSVPASLPRRSSRKTHQKKSKTFKNKNVIAKPELLAPAGNLEKMKVAFAFGADAVFAGIPDFSLRVRINDFNIKTLAEAVHYAHKLKKKVYVTVNIFGHNRHLDKLSGHIKELKKIGPDGIFVSDPGIMLAIRKIWPKANIILSTQANCTNWQAVKFWGDQGMKRVILGREVTIEEIREMRKRVPKVELESFVHGALCMAYSGRCFLSKYLTGRSANLGDCAQPCRWKYKINQLSTVIPAEAGIQGLVAEKVDPRIREDDEMEDGMLINPDGKKEVLELVEEEHGSYILNSEDLCLINRVPELIDAGLSAFKIEGRAKSVYYLATVVGAYRKAIDLSINPPYPPYQGGSKKNVPLIRGISARGGSAFGGKGVKKELLKLYKELNEKLAHRGYTEGFMFGQGKGAQNLTNAHNTSTWEFCGQVVSHNMEHVTHNKKVLIPVKVHNSIKIGDQIEIIPPGYDIIKMKVKKMFNLKTGEKLEAAHGGQDRVILVEVGKKVPEFSVIRRKLKN